MGLVSGERKPAKILALRRRKGAVHPAEAP